jgi:hypothetical protein
LQFFVLIYKKMQTTKPTFYTDLTSYYIHKEKTIKSQWALLPWQMGICIHSLPLWGRPGWGISEFFPSPSGGGSGWGHGVALTLPCSRHLPVP